MHWSEIRPHADVVEAVAGKRRTLEATVRNASPHPWPLRVDGRATLLGLGNHWIDAAGRRSAPGIYALELDLVHEGVCWFAQRGSTPVRVEVHVTARTDASGTEASDRAGSHDAEPFVPVMEVHGIRRGSSRASFRPAPAGAWESWTYLVAARVARPGRHAPAARLEPVSA